MFPDLFRYSGIRNSCDITDIVQPSVLGKKTAIDQFYSRRILSIGNPNRLYGLEFRKWNSFVGSPPTPLRVNLRCILRYQRLQLDVKMGIVLLSTPLHSTLINISLRCSSACDK